MARPRRGCPNSEKIVVTCFCMMDQRRFRFLLLAVGIVGVLPNTLLAQQSGDFADPQIKAALQEISAGQIQSDIEKLVSFQTRSTISAQDADSIKAGHGIGAAREWIKSEFERYS